MIRVRQGMFLPPCVHLPAFSWSKGTLPLCPLISQTQEGSSLSTWLKSFFISWWGYWDVWVLSVCPTCSTPNLRHVLEYLETWIKMVYVKTTAFSQVEQLDPVHHSIIAEPVLCVCFACIYLENDCVAIIPVCKDKKFDVSLNIYGIKRNSDVCLPLNYWSCHHPALLLIALWTSPAFCMISDCCISLNTSHFWQNNWIFSALTCSKRLTLGSSDYHTQLDNLGQCIQSD